MEHLSSLERIENYRRLIGAPHLSYEADWLFGHWEIGKSYKKANTYHGGFRGNFVKRVDVLYPDRDSVSRRRRASRGRTADLRSHDRASGDCCKVSLHRPNMDADTADDDDLKGQEGQRPSIGT